MCLYVCVCVVIKSFRHAGLRNFFERGTKAGIQPHHASRLKRQLAQLNVAKDPNDMKVPGWDCHPLKPPLEGHYGVSVSGNWRMTFTFEAEDAILVDYLDYH